MPPRRRHNKRREFLTGLDRVNFSVMDESDLVETFGSLDAARAIWEEERDRLRCNPGLRPEAFWIFSGPPHLRGPADGKPMEAGLPSDFTASDPWATLHARIHADMEREAARFRWLLEHGELRDDELLDLAAHEDEQGQLVREWARATSTDANGGTE